VRIFISHMVEECRLAAAWKELLRRISRGALAAWHATGDRDELVEPYLQDSKVVLAILTPRSAERPEILWECGIARGQGTKEILPLLFGCRPSGPLSTMPCCEADNREQVAALCRRLLEAGGIEEPADWDGALDTYIEAIRLSMHSVRAQRRIAPAPAWAVEAGEFGADAAQNPWVAFEVHSRLSRTYMTLHEYEMALPEVNRALALVPDDPILLHRKGLILLSLGRCDEAKKVLAQIGRIDPSARFDPEIAAFAGRVHRGLYEQTSDPSHLRSAILAYRRSYEKHPESYETGVNVAHLSMLNGEIRTATTVAKNLVTICRELQEQPPVSFRVDFALGELYLILGERERAAESFARGLGRAPRPSARELAEALARVRALFGSGRLAQDGLGALERMLG
jgi:tetratricopeptide (TPR) repeat protein